MDSRRRSSAASGARSGAGWRLHRSGRMCSHWNDEAVMKHGFTPVSARFLRLTRRGRRINCKKGKKDLETEGFHDFQAASMPISSAAAPEQIGLNPVWANGNRAGSAQERVDRSREAEKDAFLDFCPLRGVSSSVGLEGLGLGGSVILAQSWSSGPVLPPDPNGWPRCDEVCPSSVEPRLRIPQVLDLAMTSCPTQTCASPPSCVASGDSDPRDRGGVVTQILGRTRSTPLHGKGVAGAPDSLPAQPLHWFSAVARFDSSSPHGIAVRGNQEKTR